MEESIDSTKHNKSNEEQPLKKASITENREKDQSNIIKKGSEDNLVNPKIQNANKIVSNEINNKINGIHKVTIPTGILILTVLIEICEKTIMIIPLKNTFNLKFLNLSLLLDFRTTKDAIMHNIGIYKGKIVLL